VEQARLYTLPDEPPPIVVAASQERAAELAGRIGDGYMNTSPDEDTLRTYEAAGGSAPKHGKVTGCLAASPEEAKKIVHERWPNMALGGSLSQELALPRDFEAAAKTVRPDDVAGSAVLGTDADAWLEKIREFERAGFTHVALHDVNPDQQRFVEFARSEIVPRL
jgi:G6PDH family F420-dependent oxidoreductase